MQKLQQIPAFQIGVIAAAAIICLSHFGEMLLWTSLITGAIVLLELGASSPTSLSETQENPSDIQAIADNGLAAHAAVSQMFQDFWTEDTVARVIPTVTAALDEQLEWTTGTIAREEIPALDAEASDVVEPMQPMFQTEAKDKAKAPCGYRGQKIKPVSSSNELERRIVSYRLQTVLPKTTKKAWQTWSALCKQLGVQGYTAVNSANTSSKAAWLIERGITFSDVVKASLKLAA